MEMTQYQKDLVRMWDSLRPVVFKGACSCGGVSCDRCPFENTVCHNDDNGASFNAEKAIEIVNSWVKDHPLVTYEQKYEETFGVKPLDFDGDYICPYSLGLKPCKSGGGNGSPCAKCAKDFWGSEYKPPKADEEGV